MSLAASLLSNKPHKAVLVTAQGVEPGGHIEARVGRKNASWENRGSNDGAVSENAGENGQVVLGWLIYNTFRRPVDELEMHLRVMTRHHKLVGKEVMGEVKVDLRNVNQKEVKVMGVKLNLTIGSDRILVDHPNPATRTHPCGTNHFGMLPTGIDELAMNDLKGCYLWGSASEPMTSWVACHLLHHNKPFKTGPMLVQSPIPPLPKVKDYKDELVNANTCGAKSGYGVAQAPDKVITNAVPMLEIRREDDGPRMIADGVIINYLIIPLLYPQKMTPDVLRWEKIIGYEFIPAMWREYTGVEYAAAFARACPNYPATFTSRFSPVMRQPVAVMTRLMARERTILKDYMGEEYDRTPDKTTMKSIMTKFKTELGRQMGKQDFMGGETPNATDVSFYGVNILRFVTEVGPTKKLIEEVGLLPWMYRMMDILPPSKCLAPRFFGPPMEGWKGGWLVDPPQLEPVKYDGPQPEEETATTETTAAETAPSASKSEEAAATKAEPEAATTTESAEEGASRGENGAEEPAASADA
ncbi:expressed unknown protein [Seminavis robusta]|uniref:Uncharacterized protein n=1 Tax=Seminavis robusta TaxID=568900 RepID=A0A9N8D4T2_9STRA|nr:expressed unknown protein [Seminavis robusta]|eukprot:Sro5_g004310.1 n/a (527) ;mRNA; f:121945-123525